MDLRWMLRLYPRAWQERYTDEVSAVLEQRGATLATFFDLLLGALDAHLDPTHLTARPAAGAAWTVRVRLSNRLVFWAFPAFMGVWGLLRLVDANGPWSPALGVAIIDSALSTVSAIASIASALATIMAGLIVAAARLRGGDPLGRRLSRAVLPVLPPLLVGVMFALHATVLRGLPWWGVPPFVVFWFGALTLPMVVGRGIARDDLTGGELRLTMLAATVVAVSMLAHLVALVAGPMVAGPAWSDHAWSIGRVAGLAVLLLPALIAARAIGQGLVALHAHRVA